MVPPVRGRECNLTSDNQTRDQTILCRPIAPEIRPNTAQMAAPGVHGGAASRAIRRDCALRNRAGQVASASVQRLTTDERRPPSARRRARCKSRNCGASSSMVWSCRPTAAMDAHRGLVAILLGRVRNGAANDAASGPSASTPGRHGSLRANGDGAGDDQRRVSRPCAHRRQDRHIGCALFDRRGGRGSRCQDRRRGRGGGCQASDRLAYQDHRSSGSHGRPRSHRYAYALESRRREPLYGEYAGGEDRCAGTRGHPLLRLRQAARAVDHRQPLASALAARREALSDAPGDRCGRAPQPRVPADGRSIL
jgi:hypothetical protein